MELQWMEGIDLKFLTKPLQILQGLTQWCFGYEKACSNNNVAQQKSQSFQVMRSTIL